MSTKARLEAIIAECHSGLGCRTIEPDKSERLLKTLAGIVAEQEDRLTVLETATGQAPSPDTPGPDQVEGRHRNENDVTRKKRP